MKLDEARRRSAKAAAYLRMEGFPVTAESIDTIREALDAALDYGRALAWNVLLHESGEDNPELPSRDEILAEVERRIAAAREEADPR
jgi:hypothetical protein